MMIIINIFSKIIYVKSLLSLNISNLNNRKNSIIYFTTVDLVQILQIKICASFYD